MNGENLVEEEFGKNTSEYTRNLIWILIRLKIPIDLSVLVPIATLDFKFKFHHAQKDYVMLTLWLPETKDTLPGYATHCKWIAHNLLISHLDIGVGGLVINDNNEVLAIKEKNGRLKGFWKIPGNSSIFIVDCNSM